MVTFFCEYVIGGMQLQEIMEAKESIDCVLALAEDGATAIRVRAVKLPVND